MADFTPSHHAASSFALLSFEEQERWIEQCYVLPQANGALYDPERSALVIGRRSSGLSAIFDVLRHHYPLIDDTLVPPTTPHPFCFAYPVLFWPGESQALFRSDTVSHFKQWMALVAQHLVSIFRHNPLLMNRVPPMSFDFLAWLIRHYLGARRAERWYHFVEHHHEDDEVINIIAEARLGKYDTLYEDDPPGDITGQIEECLDVITGLGWNGVYAVTELGFAEWRSYSAEQQLAIRQGVERLLTHLTPLQQPQFGFKMGLVGEVIDAKTAKQLSRGRTVVVEHTWSPDDLSNMSTHLIASLTGRLVRIEDAIDSASWIVLHADMLAIWGDICPAALVAIIHSYYDLNPSFSPLEGDMLRQLRTSLYKRYAPLRYYPSINHAVVWRGETSILLDDAQVRVFHALWRHMQTKTYAPKEELRVLAGNSSSNLDKIISRIREKIEPIPNERIYLQRNQMVGIWLEGCLI